MGILNIDEHVEEHRLMAIRYPNKAVIPGTNVIAVSTIPFLIMPGDGAANGCQFTGTNGAFTLSAAIIANIGASLAGCYAYFSASFGGSSLPAGWYWTEFSSDTAGIVYAETYATGSGTPRRLVTKTAITPNLSGWVTGSTSEITGPSGFVLPGSALGKNGELMQFFRVAGSTTGNKNIRVYLGGVQTCGGGGSTSPMTEIQSRLVCVDSHTQKFPGRITSNAISGVSMGFSSATTTNIVSVDTSVNQTIDVGISGSSNLSGAILLGYSAVATYGE